MFRLSYGVCISRARDQQRRNAVLMDTLLLLCEMLVVAGACSDPPGLGTRHPSCRPDRSDPVDTPAARTCQTRDTASNILIRSATLNVSANGSGEQQRVADTMRSGSG
jgi:hypothetical protein